MNSKRGFTLIELLVVIAIIGLLASVVLASLNSARTKARDARRIADLKQMSLAIELYYDANGQYPPNPTGTWCYSDAACWTGGLQTSLAPYMSSLPKDPINTGQGPWLGPGYYTYAYFNSGTVYDLIGALEGTNNPNRCGVRNYTYYAASISWCTAFGGTYSNQVVAGH